jgi:hypothetical protein
MAAREPDFFSSDRDGDGLPDVYDEAWWGAKYLAKLQIPETGGFLDTVQQGPDRSTWMAWVAPENTTDNIVGTADDPIVGPGKGHSPMALGGWMRLAKILKARGVENDYAAHAELLWRNSIAEAPEGGGTFLLLGAMDCYLITGEQTYLDYARKSAEALMAQTHPSGQLKGGYDDTGDQPSAALALFALKLPDDPLSPKIRECLAQHVGPLVTAPKNPFGVSKQKEGEGGYYFEPTSTLGCNYIIACRAWTGFLLYQLLKDQRALVYATDQLDFILGKNPYNLCMVEGKGGFNPPRYHHRYNKIPGKERGAVPGAIPNGFVRDIASYDRPGFDLSTEGREYPSYRTSEPWLVHNVFFTLALSALPGP